MVFHVLNRANARARIFAKEEDYAAFEGVMKETVARKPMRILGYLIMPNHWHLVLWPERDGELELLQTAVKRGRPFGSEAWQAMTARKLGLESTFQPRGRPKKRK